MLKAVFAPFLCTRRKQPNALSSLPTLSQRRTIHGQFEYVHRNAETRHGCFGMETKNISARKGNILGTFDGNRSDVYDCDFKVRSSTSLSPDVKKMSAVSISTNGASSEAAMAP